MTKRKVFRLRWSSLNRMWQLLSGALVVQDFYPWLHFNKKRCVRWSADWIRGQEGLSQLRVFNKNGRIAFERTYPRSSDPKRHKG